MIHRTPRPSLVSRALPSLSLLLASGASLWGCATEAGATPVSPEPMRPAGSESVVTPTPPPPPPTPPQELQPDDLTMPVGAAGGLRPTTVLPVAPPTTVTHPTVRLPRR